MDKFVISEFGVCHKFPDKIRRDFLKQAENFSLHTMFLVVVFTFWGYFKENFDIDVFVEKVIDLSKKSDFCTYSWKVHRPLVNKGKYMKLSEDDRGSEVSITFTAV